MAPNDPIPGPAYRILTSRLVIRCPEPSDAPAMDLSIRQSIDHLRPWLLWAKDEPVSFEKRLEFIRRTRGNFDLGLDFGYFVFNPAETFLLGGSSLSSRLGMEAREIGYWIHKDYINQGYATEVAAALTKVAFEIDRVKRVEIHCNPKNSSSASVARKLGFMHEATLHDRVEDIDGSLRDAMIWSLFEASYPSSPSASADIQAYDAFGRRIL
jgi:RimJ/RimL family protein N-acetyltransferase